MWIHKLKIIICLISLASLAQYSLAQASPALIQPTEMRLTLKSQIKREGTSAEFQGQTWIKGTLNVKWIRGIDSDTLNELHIRIFPDEKSLQGLAHFEGYPIKDLEVSNEDSALKLIASPRIFSMLKRKKIMAITATGLFLIDNYIVGVECDAPWAKVTLLQFKSSTPLLYAVTSPKTDCH